MELRNNNREVIRELAQANYRKNRGRNRILTFAAALAVFMVFGAFSIARGKMDADYLLYARNGGSVASLSLENGSEKQYEKIKTLDYVKNTGVENDFAVWQKEGASVMGCTVLDNTAFEKLQKPAYTDVTGHYPREKNEVMLPLRGLEQLGIENPAAGMTLNAELLQNGSRESMEDSFVLSGYYKDYVNPLLNAPIAYFSEAYLESLGIPKFPASYILMEQDGILADGEFMEEKLYEDVQTESVSQQFIGMNSLTFTVVEDFAGSYLVAFLCSVMILGGAFLLIYNVLSITFGNDIRQYGLLKTIGTTNSQIRKIVFRQTGKVILAGCLMGAAAGSLVMKFVLPGTLGELYLHGMGSARGMTGFYPGFLAVSVVFVSMTTLLAAGIAVRKVMRLSPIESVRYEETTSVAAGHTGGRLRPALHRQNSARRDGGRRNHCGDGTSFAGMAWRNIVRSRRRFTVTLLSLSIGCVSALGAVVISRGTDITNSIEERPDFDISTFANIVYDAGSSEYDWNDDTPVITEEIRDKILAVDGVTAENTSYTKGCFAMLDMPSATKGIENSGDEALLPRLKSVYGSMDANFFTTVQIVDDAFVKELREYADAYGIKADVESLENGTGAMLLHTRFRQITNSKREVRTPEDVKRLKIRVPGSEVYMKFFKTLGADPVAMSWSEVFTAIQQGTIDGQENGICITESAKMDEIQDYLTLWNYTYENDLFVANTEIWESLEQKTRELLQEKAREACEWGRDTVEEEEAAIVEEFKSEGMTVTELNAEEMDAFKDEISGVKQEFIDKYGEKACKAFRIESE